MQDRPKVEEMCCEFVTSVSEYDSSLLAKPKFHLLMHLSENMTDFGPTSCFNTERYMDN